MYNEIIIPKAGPPTVFATRSVERKALAANQVRVRVKAAGINFADISARLGFYPDAPPMPFSPGYEISGEVIEVGSEVSLHKLGDPVSALTRFGGYAEEVVLEAEPAFAVPAGVDLKAAAGIPVTYLTAHVCLYEAGGHGDGRSVLILGGAGGVGSAAIQMCKRNAGAILTTAGSEAKCEWTRSAGADHAFNYHEVDLVSAVRAATGGRGVDLVLDPNGGRSVLRSLQCCAPLGRVIVFGVRDANPGKTRSFWPILREVLPLRFFNLISLLTHNLGVHGVNLLTYSDAVPERVFVIMNQILASTAAGELTPVIDSEFPLTAAGAAAAHDHIQERRNIGKVLLVASGD